MQRNIKSGISLAQVGSSQRKVGLSQKKASHSEKPIKKHGGIKKSKKVKEEELVQQFYDGETAKQAEDAVIGMIQEIKTGNNTVFTKEDPKLAYIE